MMANPWFRVYHEWADDPKIQMMPEPMQRRFIMLLCDRCKGETLQERERAFLWRITEDQLAETKAIFIEKGFIDESWNVLNWNKRQFISDSSTERVRRHRQAKKQCETLHETDETEIKHQQPVTETAPDADAESKLKQKPKAASPEAPLFELPPFIPADAWQGFEEMRRKLRKPLTDRARRGIVKKLEAYEKGGQGAAGDVLDQSTMSGWADVYPLKAEERNGPSQTKPHASPTAKRVAANVAAIDAALARRGIRRTGAAAGTDDDEISGTRAEGLTAIMSQP